MVFHHSQSMWRMDQCGNIPMSFKLKWSIIWGNKLAMLELHNMELKIKNSIVLQIDYSQSESVEGGALDCL